MLEPNTEDVDVDELRMSPVLRTMYRFEVENIERDLLGLKSMCEQVACRGLEEQYGLGVWTMELTPEVQEILDLQRGTRSKMGEARYDRERELIGIIAEDIDSHFKFSPGDSEYVSGNYASKLEAGEISTLPSGSVRVVRERILAWQNWNDRNGPGSREATTLEPRILQSMRCGSQFVTRDQHGNLLAHAKPCGLAGCTRPTCWSSWSKKKKDGIAKSLENLEDYRKKAGGTLVMFTLKTPWELPEDDRKFQYQIPILEPEHCFAVQDQFVTRNPDAESWSPASLQDRSARHKQNRESFLGSRITKRICSPHTTWVTELAFLTPSTPGTRHLPNVHSHILTVIPLGTEPEEAAAQLAKIWKRAVGNPEAQVLVAELETPYQIDKHDTRSQFEQTRDSISSYLRKTSSVTLSEDQFETPAPSSTSGLICNQSLAEYVAFFESSPQLRGTVHGNVRLLFKLETRNEQEEASNLAASNVANVAIDKPDFELGPVGPGWYKKKRKSKAKLRKRGKSLRETALFLKKINATLTPLQEQRRKRESRNSLARDLTFLRNYWRSNWELELEFEV